MSATPAAEPSLGPIRFIVVGVNLGTTWSYWTSENEGIESRGGLRVPPNMTLALERLPGLKELLRTHNQMRWIVSTVRRGVYSLLTLHAGETSKIYGRMQFLNETRSELGCHFYTIPYDVLVPHLLNICRKVGVQLRFQTEVASVIVVAGQRPSVVTTMREHIDGDLLIGADGRQGIIRAALSQQQKDEDEEDDSEVSPSAADSAVSSCATNGNY
ncbi:hypothetical protein C8R44DRAFT_889449 [Mycena epipterygia]|nr:hypothetical protein C8R44DRAFT_889449 [Mycena epipterygia]